MPRSLARRFDPIFGVSEKTLTWEGQNVRRELDHYTTRSIDELRERLRQLQIKLVASEANLQHALGSLPDRKRLSIRCLIARDQYHFAELYNRVLSGVEATGHREVREEELTDQHEPKPLLVFQETLFG